MNWKHVSSGSSVIINQNQNHNQNQTQRGPTELPRINSASCAPHPPRAAAIAMQEERRHRLASR